jgi:multidrug resistance efflux pump
MKAATAPVVDETAPTEPWHPRPRRKIATVMLLVAAIGAAFAVLAAWHLPPFRNGAQSTDNAYVRGRTTAIAPQVIGYVSEVLVRDYQYVHKGQILVRVDDAIYQARVAQAQANLDAQRATLSNSTQSHAARTADVVASAAGLTGAQAQLQKARADMSRADDLVRDGSISRREYDQTLAALRAALAGVRQSQAAGDVAREGVRTVDVGRGGLEAQVEAAAAALRLAQIDLEHTIIRAPDDGQLGEVGVRKGQFVTNGTQLFSLVPPQKWIIANYKEAQTSRMHVGQRADLRIDALGGAKLTGHVAVLAPATGSEFAVLKPDNATGNFVKVPQRIGVLIVVDGEQPLAGRLRPGMSVEARVDTRS